MIFVSDVLGHLPDNGSWVAAKHLRAVINQDRWWWDRISLAAFYEYMTGLEEKCLVVSQLIPTKIGGEWVVQKHYAKSKATYEDFIAAEEV